MERLSDVSSGSSCGESTSGDCLASIDHIHVLCYIGIQASNWQIQAMHDYSYKHI